ncbi:MAG: hypothetical protein ACYC27_02700 [Armatimonadota bacterium]
MDLSNPGLIGVIIVSLSGITGGIIGTWVSIRNVRTPDKRCAMIRLNVIIWSMLILLICLPIGLAITNVIPKWVYRTCFTIFNALLIFLISKSISKRDRQR